jgi:hypothetical protein
LSSRLLLREPAASLARLCRIALGLLAVDGDVGQFGGDLLLEPGAFLGGFALEALDPLFLPIGWRSLGGRIRGGTGTGTGSIWPWAP